MAFIIDRTTIPTNGNFFNFNGVNAEKVICDGVEVWRKIVDIPFGSAANPLWSRQIRNWGYDDNDYDDDVFMYVFQNTGAYRSIKAYVQMLGHLNGDNTGWGAIVGFGTYYTKPSYDPDENYLGEEAACHYTSSSRVSNGVSIQIPSGVTGIGVGFWFKSQEDGSWEGSDAIFSGWASFSP